MKKTLLFILIIISAIACNKSKIVVVEEYEDGNPKTVREYIKNDTLNYIETQYYPDNIKLLEGKCVNGKREGRWNAWYKDGTLWSEGDFKDGKNNGYHAIFYEDGTKRYSGNYLDGKRVGAWNFYDTLGVLIQTIEY